MVAILVGIGRPGKIPEQRALLHIWADDQLREEMPHLDTVFSSWKCTFLWKTRWSTTKTNICLIDVHIWSYLRAWGGFMHIAPEIWFCIRTRSKNEFSNYRMQREQKNSQPLICLRKCPKDSMWMLLRVSCFWCALAVLWSWEKSLLSAVVCFWWHSDCGWSVSRILFKFVQAARASPSILSSWQWRPLFGFCMTPGPKVDCMK